MTNNNKNSWTGRRTVAYKTAVLFCNHSYRSSNSSINWRKARHHKVFIIDTLKNKTKYEKHFFAQKVRDLWVTHLYFLDQAFLAQTNCVDCRIDQEKFWVNFCQFSHTIFHILSHPSGQSCYKFESFEVEVLKYHPKVIECLRPV